MSAKLIVKSTLALMLTVSLAACDSDSSVITETENESTETSTPTPGTDPGDPITLSVFTGVWTRACTASADNATYSTATLTTSNDVATIAESFYTDSACSIADSPALIETQRSMVFYDTATATSLGEASNVDWTTETRTVDGEPGDFDSSAVVYDIMLVINDTMYFGDRSGENNGTTEALRPTTLDQINIYTSSD